MAVAVKSDQRHSKLGCELNREARRSADGRKYGNPCHQGLLHKLKASSAADQECLVRERDFRSQKFCTDHFVERVVPADILANNLKLALSVK